MNLLHLGTKSTRRAVGNLAGLLSRRLGPSSEGDTGDLVRVLHGKYASELDVVAPKLSSLRERTIFLETGDLPEVSRDSEGRAVGTTGLADCLFLYLLARTQNAQVVFEVGTWLGMSAMAIAEAVVRNGGGVIYTCDLHDVSRIEPEYQSHIVRLPFHSDKALNHLRKRRVGIDMVFADGILSRRNVVQLSIALNPGFVFATHDYKPPAEKGCQNVRLMQRWFPAIRRLRRGRETYTLYLPTRQGSGYEACDGIRVNSSTAVLLAESSV